MGQSGRKVGKVNVENGRTRKEQDRGNIEGQLNRNNEKQCTIEIGNYCTLSNDLFTKKPARRMSQKEPSGEEMVVNIQH